MSLQTSFKRKDRKKDLEDVDPNIVVLYHSGNTRGVRHLAVPDDGKTLCRKVDLDYNSEGDLNSTKVSEFKGRDRVLGDLCSVCEKRFEKILDEGEGLND